MIFDNKKVTNSFDFHHFIQVHIQVNLPRLWTCLSAKRRKFWWEGRYWLMLDVVSVYEFFYAFVKLHKIVESFLERHIFFQQKLRLMIFIDIAWCTFPLGQRYQIQIVNWALFIKGYFITDDGNIDCLEAKVPEVKHVVNLFFKVFTQH